MISSTLIASITTYQRRPCLLQAGLPRTHSDRASMLTEQSLLPSDNRQHMHSLVHRQSAQLFHPVLFQVFAEHRPTQPANTTDYNHKFTTIFKLFAFTRFVQLNLHVYMPILHKLTPYTL